MTASQIGPPRFSVVDARSILPVEDDIGGVAIYVSGKLSYYVLDGEWIEAISEETGSLVESDCNVVEVDHWMCNLK